MTAISGVGAQHEQPDPRGWLVFHGLPADLQRAEDTTQAADQAQQKRQWGRTWTRPATTTERALLIHLGYTVPAELITRVEYLSATLRRRTWPALETD